MNRNRWHKSSHSFSNGNCTEVATGPAGAFRKAAASESGVNCAEIGSYRKSSASINVGQCLEAGTGPQVVGVRDSKQKDIGYPDVLEFSPKAWMRFLAEIRGAR